MRGRRPLFSDIVEARGQSPLSARSASFFCYQVVRRHRLDGPKAWWGPRAPSLRRPAGFCIDAVYALYAANLCPESRRTLAHGHGWGHEGPCRRRKRSVTEHPGQIAK